MHGACGCTDCCAAGAGDAPWIRGSSPAFPLKDSGTATNVVLGPTSTIAAEAIQAEACRRPCLHSHHLGSIRLAVTRSCRLPDCPRLGTQGWRWDCRRGLRLKRSDSCSGASWHAPHKARLALGLGHLPATKCYNSSSPDGGALGAQGAKGAELVPLGTMAGAVAMACAGTSQDPARPGLFTTLTTFGHEGSLSLSLSLACVLAQSVAWRLGTPKPCALPLR